MGPVSLHREEIRAQTHTVGECEDSHLQAKERGLRRNQPCRHLDIGLLTSNIVRKLICVVHATQSVVLYFVMRVLTNIDITLK